jgi:Cys-rich protein (TIGR01571 family)
MLRPSSCTNYFKKISFPLHLQTKAPSYLDSFATLISSSSRNPSSLIIKVSRSQPLGMVLSKETDSVSGRVKAGLGRFSSLFGHASSSLILVRLVCWPLEDSTIVADEVTRVDPGISHSPEPPNAYIPSGYTDNLKSDPSLDVAVAQHVADGEEEVNGDEFGQERNWSYGLFHCFNIFCKPLFWMSWCCTPLVFGQLMTRLKLNWCGQPDKVHGGARTFGTVAILFIAFLFLEMIGWEGVGLVFWVYCLFVFMRTRGAFRRQFRIPTETCHGCHGRLEDFCCGLWCSCCSAIQMARHTHNEKRYPYEPCSPSGLPIYAPVLVVREDDEDTIAVDEV